MPQIERPLADDAKLILGVSLPHTLCSRRVLSHPRAQTEILRPGGLHKNGREERLTPSIASPIKGLAWRSVLGPPLNMMLSVRAHTLCSRCVSMSPPRYKRDPPSSLASIWTVSVMHLDRPPMLGLQKRAERRCIAPSVLAALQMNRGWMLGELGGELTQEWIDQNSHMWSEVWTKQELKRESMKCHDAGRLTETIANVVILDDCLKYNHAFRSKSRFFFVCSAIPVSFLSNRLTDFCSLADAGVLGEKFERFPRPKYFCQWSWDFSSYVVLSQLGRKMNSLIPAAKRRKQVMSGFGHLLLVFSAKFKGASRFAPTDDDECWS